MTFAGQRSLPFLFLVPPRRPLLETRLQHCGITEHREPLGSERQMGGVKDGMMTGTGYLAVEGILSKQVFEPGLSVDSGRWDVVEECLQTRRVVRSWRIETVTELGTAKHLEEEQSVGVLQ